ncbi:MAG: hypothetical protein ACKVH0_08615, partial [Alphaproteobacteria bacterium]
SSDSPPFASCSGNSVILYDLSGRTLRGKTTIVMVTHRPSHMRIADRILHLEDGRLLDDGPPDEVLPKILPSQPPPTDSQNIENKQYV